MNALRAFLALLVVVCAPFAVFLCLRDIFLPGERSRGCRRLAAWFLAALAVLCGYLAAVWLAVPLPLAARWALAYPALALVDLSVPLALLLGGAITAARRFRRKERARPALASLALSLPESRRRFLARAAKGALAGAGALGVLGLCEAESEPEVTRHDLFLRGLHPDLEGLTLLQLSDIHAGALMTEGRMRTIALQAAALAADVVVITGDLLDASARAAEPFARAFLPLRGRLATLMVLGNHDYYASPGAAEEAARGAGGVLLRNRGARLGRGGGSLWIGGVDDPLAWSTGAGRVDATQALGGALPGEPRILLAHRPALFAMGAAAGAQVVLSGHTHGGQLALSPRLSMARLITPYTMGLFRENGAQLYVHRGMGVVAAAPMRIGSRPEIALFALRRL